MIAQPVRRVTDAEILVGRTHLVALISEAMLADNTWRDAAADDSSRRTVARRIAFTRWLVRERGLIERGEATDVQA